MLIASKIALITGGAQGLGKAFAVALLQKKAGGICLIDVNPKGKETADELAATYKTPVDFIHCDVSDYIQLKRAFDITKKKFGHIDIVCNNAAIATEDEDLNHSIKAFRVNLEGVYFGTVLGQEYMNVNDGGRGGIVVNVSSMAGMFPLHSSMVYTATKHGVLGLSRAAGNEGSLAEYGVRINCLCPSFSDTAMVDLFRASLGSDNRPILSPAFVAEGFTQLVEDDSKNGAVMRVTSEKGIDYKKYRDPLPPSKL